MFNRIVVLGIILEAACGGRVLVTPESSDRAQPEVSVRVFKSDGVSGMTMNHAENVTKNILASAGVRVRWAESTGRVQPAMHSADCGAAGARESIDIRFAYTVPLGYKPGALAEAFPFANCGVRITVFFDRVARLFEAHLAPDSCILGHVLAHEIGHVLLRVESHSQTGVMKARWTNHDLMDMRLKSFTFTPESIALIQSNLAKREESLLLAARAF